MLISLTSARAAAAFTASRKPAAAAASMEAPRLRRGDDAAGKKRAHLGQFNEIVVVLA